MGPDTTNVVTLANSIIGVGILAMPFCFQKCGILLSICLLILSNFITRLSCHYLAKASILSRRRNYEYLAFYAFGSSGKLMVELCIIGYLFGTSVAYHVVVGDLGPQIISQLFNITNSDTLRLWVLILMTALVVLPLGLLKNIDSLSSVCTVSIGFYFCFVLKVIGESKEPLLSGDWKSNVNWWEPSGLLQCLPIFSMALSCQMQLFEVSETMPGVSLDRMNNEVKSATWICTVVYILVGFFGYVAFCSQEFSGNILVNLSQSLSSDVIKIGFVISIAFSFPLVIFPCRASLYSLLRGHDHLESNPYIPEGKFRALTASIVFCSLLAGLVIPSVELVIGLVGSTIGIAICIVFPACCFTQVSKKESTEMLLAKFMIVCGFCLMVLGTYANLNAIDSNKAAVHVPEQSHLPELNLNDLHPILKEPDSKLEYKVVSEAMNEVQEKPNIVEKKVLEDKKKTERNSKEKEDKIVEDRKLEVEKEKMKEKEIAEAEELRNPLSNDAIKKEDDELRADKESKLVVQEELNAVVDEMKRQNEESQKKVLEKLEEIVEKIEHKHDPVPVEAAAHVVDEKVMSQVRDKFPDPIPLRGLNNNINDPPHRDQSNNLVGQEKIKEGHEEVVERVENVGNDINLNLIVNKTKEKEAQESVAKEVPEDKKAGELKSEVIDKKEVQREDNKVDEKPKPPLPDEDDVEAIRRDLLNVDTDTLARFKRSEDCEKEI